jgi:toxin HigB-1
MTSLAGAEKQANESTSSRIECRRRRACPTGIRPVRVSPPCSWCGRSPVRDEPGGAPLITLDGNTAVRYYGGVIRSFANSDTERIFDRLRVPRLGPDVQRAANRKLLILDAADLLQDLRIPPGNRLERLQGDRAGQHSIRVNDQWRICFTWTDTGPTDVELVDYH